MIADETRSRTKAKRRILRQFARDLLNYVFTHAGRIKDVAALPKQSIIKLSFAYCRVDYKQQKNTSQGRYIKENQMKSSNDQATL